VVDNGTTSLGFLGQQPFYFPPISIPTLPGLNLTDDEKRLVSLMESRGRLARAQMLISDAYYRGMQVIRDLGIAIPPQLSGLRTLVGVPRLAVDPIVERCALDSFRFPNQTDANQDLTDVWTMNGGDSELTLALTDTKALGRSWVTVGSPIEAGDAPMIRAESPLNISALWDVRTLKPSAVLQAFWLDEQRHAAVMFPDQTITVAQNNDYQWVVVDRDQHNFGEVPIRRIPNRARANFRDGYSAITPELMSITDAMCRTLLGLEVSREFYSVPQKIILGATEADFQNADGTPKSAWSTYISNVLALEADEDGNKPEIKQLQPYDPSVYTKLIDMYSGIAAGILGVPAQYVGLYTQGNPVSAEAAQVSESRLDRQAKNDMSSWNQPLREVAQLALRFMNNGVLPEEARRLQVDWKDPAMLSISQVSDAYSKQASEGMVPATSDVVLKRLGYSDVERARLAADRAVDGGESLLLELAKSLSAKAARVDKSVLADIGGPNAPTAADVANGGTNVATPPAGK
jgi:hypothetical protein